MEFPYERAAMNGLEMPDRLDAVDQWMFLSLRMLYDQNKKGIISRDAGRAEKGKLIEQYRKMSNRFRLKEKLSEYFSTMVSAVERAANAYAKNRTLENADRLYKALYGMEPTKKEEI